MDFQNPNVVWKLKRFCRSCIESIVNVFVPVSFIFSLNFSISFIFRSVKSILKASFSPFCFLEVIMQSFISLIKV